MTHVSHKHTCHKMQGEKVNMMHECMNVARKEKMKPSINTPPESTLSPSLALNAKNKTKDPTGEQKQSCRVSRSVE
jgi:hypothetical protein